MLEYKFFDHNDIYCKFDCFGSCLIEHFATVIESCSSQLFFLSLFVILNVLYSLIWLSMPSFLSYLNKDTFLTNN